MSTIYCISIKSWGTGTVTTRSFDSMLSRELWRIGASQYGTVTREWMDEAEDVQPQLSERKDGQ